MTSLVIVMSTNANRLGRGIISHINSRRRSWALLVFFRARFLTTSVTALVDTSTDAACYVAFGNDNISCCLRWHDEEFGGHISLFPFL
jgi:hypothetical protein